MVKWSVQNKHLFIAAVVALQIIKLCIQFFIIIELKVTLDKVFNFMIVVLSVILGSTLIIACF